MLVSSRQLARRQAVGTTATIAGHLWEAARHLELDGGTQGISDGEAEEGSTLAIEALHSQSHGSSSSSSYKT